MKLRQLILLFGLTALFFGCSKIKDTKQESIKEPTEWSHTWMVHTDKNDLPRVLIIGNSHVENYYRIVASELQGDAYCCKLTTSKSLGDPVLIDEIELILKQYEFDVIAFNNGLHGKGYTEEQYGSYIPILYDLFRQHSEADIIWINTTALRSKENMNDFDPFNDRIIKRNQLIEDFIENMEISLVDLYSLSVAHSEYYKRDGCHFNQDGVVAEGITVTNAIREFVIPD